MGDRPAQRRNPGAAEPPGDGLVGPGRRADREAPARSADARHVHLWNASVPLSAQDVAEITRLLEESEFDELHLEHEGFLSASPTPGPAAKPVPTSRDPRDEYPAPVSDGALLDVPAPLFGTFHRAPKPGAAPYSEIGSVVQEDTIIGIIEVMKLMNTVRAGVQGTVVEILAQDGALVEYGQVLLRISRGPERG
ncbi:MAG: hypothetical protein E6K52_00045 [Gammaproteobacteria bacterium]|nr:MAG: hypothetical protein E6K52_00045 [Gammaproteobacteria bacterium]